jgi:hypothetical protein
MTNNSKILSSIEQTDNRTVVNLAEEFDISEVRNKNIDYDDRLAELQDLIIEILAQTGTDIFDDEAQWHTYQNTIAALVLTDRERDQDESRSLAEHGISKPARGNYNPLGELNELDEPTVEELGDRYNVENILNTDEDITTSMRLQQLLGMALLNIAPARVPGKHNVELDLLAAMVCVDERYNTKTTLEVNTVTRTTTGYDGDELEYEVPEMTFKQETDVDQDVFTNV